MSYALRCLVCCLTALSFAGCGQSPAPEKSAKPEAKDSSPANGESPAKQDAAKKSQASAPTDGDTSPANEGEEIPLLIRDHKGLMDLVASKKGKVVVMDCWSTSCDPCMKEFHNLVEIHNEHGAEKVACISVSADNIGLAPIEELKPAVLEFLTSQKATFDNVLSSEIDSDLYEKLEIPSGIPAVFVYDQEGQLAAKYTVEDSGEEGVGYERVKAKVEELLKP